MGEAGRCIENVKRKATLGGDGDIDEDKSLEMAWYQLFVSRT
jgi:hypothetical protein